MTRDQKLKPDFLSDPINHVAVFPGSNLCGLVTWGGWVRLFGIKENAFLHDIFTHKSSDGVSVAMSTDDRLCFVGTYHAWGLACCDAVTGEILWRRDDLKKFYGLSYSGRLGRLFGFLDGKPAVQINPQTGVSEETFRGVSFVAASPFDDSVLHGDRKTFTMTRGRAKRLWSTDRESFAVHVVAWSDESVLISEVSETRPDSPRSGLRCFSIADGSLRWRHEGRFQNRNSSFTSACHDSDRRAFSLVEVIPGSADRYFVRLDEMNGSVVSDEPIPETIKGVTVLAGDKILSVGFKDHVCSVHSFA